MSEEALWLAVIGRALEDCMPDIRINPPYLHVNVMQLLDIQRARKYFSGTNKEFVRVCCYAGLDPLFVLRKVKPMFDKYDKYAVIKVRKPRQYSLAMRERLINELVQEYNMRIEAL
ncbi:MAG: hypothetical protein KGL39_11625 [Patescibacteria group bacterium]|nr:hypothetical protein [Patescibacteria group bacterium]